MSASPDRSARALPAERPPAATRDAGELRPGLNLVWLVRLRWSAVVGQLVAMVVAHAWLEIALPWVVLLIVLAIVAATNVFAHGRSRQVRPLGEPFLFRLMAFDVVALSVLLAFTGGPVNPFNFLYLVHLTLAALMLRPAHTWVLVGLSVALFGALFFEPAASASAGMSHLDQMTLHLRGMWVAFAVAAFFIVFFLGRLTRALAARETELAAARERAARTERLVALAGLAAGAAHELATPLGTVAVVTREMARALEAGRVPDALLDDVRLVRGQVDRCRAILDRMSLEAGESAGEAADHTPVSALVDGALSDRADRDRFQVDLGVCPPVRAFRRATVEALRNVLDNAARAAPGGTVVGVTAAVEGDRVLIRVADPGPGMSADVLARVGEPFFTTREPGQGIGLGLYLSRSVLEALGGELRLESSPGQGTVVTLELPAAHEREPSDGPGRR